MLHVHLPSSKCGEPYAKKISSVFGHFPGVGHPGDSGAVAGAEQDCLGRRVLGSAGKSRASRLHDILTHILNLNGYRAGANELTPGLLENVMLVGKNGPQPVPDGSLVITVGCLSQSPDGVWVLFNATEPVRTRRSTTSPAELSASSQKRLGTLIFRLADLEAVPAFAPDSHKGFEFNGNARSGLWVLACFCRETRKFGTVGAVCDRAFLLESAK